ncbi:MAG: hypothetical protein RL368_1605 [Pseudomonadota bacterium]|jgi:DNA (cytosine-5)-methyltransferase 1
MITHSSLRFIDLFAGMGGFRLGFENSCRNMGITPSCILSSEIKSHAITVYQDNFKGASLVGDITQINAKDIPDFDVLLAGFPCQAFSNAGKRQGFLDTRGTLFFEIERILQEKRPSIFILENVEGLVTHDKDSPTEKMGKTLRIILEKLNQLNYFVNWQVFDAKNFGLAQSRKRIFIVGSTTEFINLDNFPIRQTRLKTVLEQGKAVMNNRLSQLLLEHFPLHKLHGKSVKDKRGGIDNIHSWDIELKGRVSQDQRDLLEAILLARRNKKWAISKGIAWMDGMPLTCSEIETFFQHPNLDELLQDLACKNYLKFEHPKDLVEVVEDGKTKLVRKYREDLEKGYNIVAGKLSYEINKILDPEDIAPTLTATDLDRVVVPDTTGIRKLTLVEQCRLFGFPDNFQLNISERLAHDLFGNTVPVSVVTAVATRAIEQLLFKRVFPVKKSPIVEDKTPLQYSFLD